MGAGEEGLRRTGIYVYVIMADSHCRMAETNTTL